VDEEAGVVHLKPTDQTHGPRITISHPWADATDWKRVHVKVNSSPFPSLDHWDTTIPAGLLSAVNFYIKLGLPVWVDMLCVFQQTRERKASQIPSMGMLFAHSFTAVLGPNGHDFEYSRFVTRLWTLQESMLGNIIVPQTPDGLQLLELCHDTPMLVEYVKLSFARTKTARDMKKFLETPTLDSMKDLCRRRAFEVGGNGLAATSNMLRQLLGMHFLSAQSSAIVVALSLLGNNDWANNFLGVINSLVRLQAACFPADFEWQPNEWYLVEALKRKSVDKNDWPHAAFCVPMWLEFGELLPSDPTEAMMLASHRLRLPPIYVAAHTNSSCWPSNPDYPLFFVPSNVPTEVEMAIVNVPGGTYNREVGRPMRFFFQPSTGWFGIGDGECAKPRAEACVMLTGINDVDELTQALPHLLKQGRVGPFLRFALALCLDANNVPLEQAGTLSWVGDGMPAFATATWETVSIM